MCLTKLIFLQLPECQWIECIDPPEISNMAFEWDGDPVAFGRPVMYQCIDGHDFEDDKDKLEIEILCEDSGKFNVTSGHPRCLANVHCMGPPPPKPRLGHWSWSNGTNYDSVITYICAPNAVFEDGTETLEVVCQWNTNWSREAVPECIRKMNPIEV